MRVSDQQLYVAPSRRWGAAGGGGWGAASRPAATKDAPARSLITITLIVALIKCRFVAAPAAAGGRRRARAKTARK